ncbi:tripartite tricarboxylate transporter permease [Pseudooceanicola sp. CBS1P-1]|uniref:Tricarboxylate transporter family protein n=1 Tax=Pseudooceanicola albus TaxID=2692189 RepID=A0A6L7G9E8_9RHOB|nr:MULTISPECIES: tripartite tricarboxylate transporter permease [Pseudooceanicola]MBT9384414.1 tripartite tricarboxylate transporter permease [Pseudooceanicola endophyticus]MXN20685.1 Tricarboxylate transporter family protein [Pseudooceanicola albus]
MFDVILHALAAAAAPMNLVFIAFGITLGIVIGVLPGLGSVTAMAVLIPLTFYMSPLAAIAFLVGVNKGGTSGGAIPAILLNAPGSPEAAATAWDGHPMARRGQAFRAMKFALFSSVTGDTLSDLLLIVLVVPFASFALQFGPVEYTAVLLFSFALIAGIAGDSPLKSGLAIFFGLFLATIGLDPVSSTPRMTFGHIELYDGLSLSALAIGALALGAVVMQVSDLASGRAEDDFAANQADTPEGRRLPAREFFSYWKTLLRGALTGSLVGMLPGLGVTLASFLSYSATKRASKTPEKFGTGIPEGIVATESANSAVVGSNLIPTIALGIPGNIAAALLIGALVMHGVVPGPFMLQMHGDLIYGLFASMILANLLHLIIGRAGLSLWVQFARIPRRLILPPVLMFCIFGIYLPNQSLWDVGIMLACAGLGILFTRAGISVVCTVIGFLLGSMFETSLRQALLLYQVDGLKILQSPVAAIFLLLAIAVVLRAIRNGRKKDSAA